ncbi:hypothetical protein [Nonomuraea zeae]|nr:hypothetical protein [Nonomuraea zeae]
MKQAEHEETPVTDRTRDVAFSRVAAALVITQLVLDLKAPHSRRASC